MKIIVDFEWMSHPNNNQWNRFFADLYKLGVDHNVKISYNKEDK